MVAAVSIDVTTPAGQRVAIDPATIRYITELGMGLGGVPIVLPGHDVPRTWMLLADNSWLAVRETRVVISIMAAQA